MREGIHCGQLTHLRQHAVSSSVPAAVAAAAAADSNTMLGR